MKNFYNFNCKSKLSIFFANLRQLLTLLSESKHATTNNKPGRMKLDANSVLGSLPARSTAWKTGVSWAKSTKLPDYRGLQKVKDKLCSILPFT